MSLTVVVQETAIRALARIRSEDKDAFAQIRRAMSALADQPRPDAAVAGETAGSTACIVRAYGSCMRLMIAHRLST